MIYPSTDLCRVCLVGQIDPTPRKHGSDDADGNGPTRQHELDHTDHTRPGIDDISALKYLDDELWELMICR